MANEEKKSLDDLIFDEDLDLTQPEVFYTLSKIFEEGRGVDRHVGLTSFFLRVAKAIENESGITVEKEEPFVVEEEKTEEVKVNFAKPFDKVDEEVTFDESGLDLEKDIDFDLDALMPKEYDEDYSLEELLSGSDDYQPALEEGEMYESLLQTPKVREEIQLILPGEEEDIELETTQETEMPVFEEVVEETEEVTLEPEDDEEINNDDVLIFDLQGLGNVYDEAVQENQEELNLADARMVINHQNDYTPEYISEAREYIGENGNALDCYTQGIELIQQDCYEEGLNLLRQVENKQDCSEELLTRTYAVLALSDNAYAEKALDLAWKNRDMYDAQKFLNYFYTHDCDRDILASLDEDKIQAIYQSLNRKHQNGDAWLNKLISLRNDNAVRFKDTFERKIEERQTRNEEREFDILQQLEDIKKLVD